MQLTKQDCIRQQALMYIKNKCTVKLFKLFENMFHMFSKVFDTGCKSYFNI